MMRVITGIARGRKLQTLPGEAVTRPTTESVKEALFSMIQFELENRKVLDLFAGSGQLGIEALSRGARLCTFVENNRAALRIIQENLDHCRLANQAQVVCSEATAYLSRKENFDIAFLDPPYGKGWITRCLPLLAPLLAADGIVVCETARDDALPELLAGLSVYRQRNYGKTKLTLYRRNGKD